MSFLSKQVLVLTMYRTIPYPTWACRFSCYMQYHILHSEQVLMSYIQHSTISYLSKQVLMLYTVLYIIPKQEGSHVIYCAVPYPTVPERAGPMSFTVCHRTSRFSC